MHRAILIAIGFALVASVRPLFAQRPNPLGPLSTFEADWAAVLAHLHAPPATRDPNGKRKTRADKVAEVKQLTARSRQAAKMAREFYTRYPSAPQYSEARKIEALTALQGVEDGDSLHRQSAIGIATAFRQEARFSAQDRLEVAMALVRLEESAKRKGKPVVDVAAVAASQDLIINQLRAEFGDQPELDTYRLELANSSSMATATAFAQKLVTSTAAPPKVKAAARTIVDRGNLVGKPLRVQLPALDGSQVDLSQRGNTTTVVLVWDGGNPSNLDELMRFGRRAPRGVEFVYLAIGGTKAEVQAAVGDVPFPGLYCHVPAGTNAQAIMAALKVTTAPYLYVVNRTGQLAGFGPASELPALLAQHHRKS